ncbi:flagellar protein G [Halovenus sp. WSH3]|uniref:Flagellar protein G n=1 Tax=Halovenus carboxidivorans TaxID=2692199 RepID=A0A6B0TAS9_9EURY|nr:flagellar protein G [Halovenus carboxidivorans]MXR52713.1 flagellar protein G [Halovenus carboxidivorans]
MASVSVSHLIIFIAAMLVAGSVAGLLTTTVDDISRAIEDQGFSTSDEIRSDISIINDAGATSTNSSGSTTNVTLYVKNTGSSELSTQPEDIDVLINGQFVTGIGSGRITLLEGAEVWSEGEVVEIVVDVSDVTINDPGENRAQVRVQGGEDVFVWEQ